MAPNRNEVMDVAKVDRRKYAWDVMEHVLGGVRAIDPDEPRPKPDGHAGASPWTLHVMPSRAELHVLPEEDDDPPRSY